VLTVTIDHDPFTRGETRASILADCHHCNRSLWRGWDTCPLPAW